VDANFCSNPTKFFARAAFEEDVVRHDHRRPADNLQQGEDVLDEVELLVAGGRPEVFADDHTVFRLGLALLVDDVTLLFYRMEDSLAPSRRSCRTVLKAVMPGGNTSSLRRDPVQVYVHRADKAQRRSQFHRLDQSPEPASNGRDQIPSHIGRGRSCEP
jgi:hypothetical protein